MVLKSGSFEAVIILLLLSHVKYLLWREGCVDFDFLWPEQEHTVNVMITMVTVLRIDTVNVMITTVTVLMIDTVNVMIMMVTVLMINTVQGDGDDQN